MTFSPVGGSHISICGFGPPTAVTGQSTAPIGGNTYRLTDETKRVISPSAPLVVKVGGTTADPSSYVADLLFGKVTFNSSQGASTITFDYSWIPYSEVLAGYRSVEISGTTDLVDATGFGTRSKQKCPTLIDCSVKFGRMGQAADKPLETGDSYLQTLLGQAATGGVPILLQVAFDDNKTKLFRGFFLMKSLSDKGSTADIVSEELSFEATGWPNAASGVTLPPFGFSF